MGSAVSVAQVKPMVGSAPRLVEVGSTLRIVFSDGAIIELLNSYSSADDAFSSYGYVGTLPVRAVEPLLQTSDNQLLTSHGFAKSYRLTKISGSYLIVLQSEHRDDVQALGTEIGPYPSDVAPPPTPPDLFQPSLPDFPPVLPSPPPLPAANSNPFVTTDVDHGITTEDVWPPMASGAIEFADVDPGATLTDSFTVTTVATAPPWSWPL